MRMKLKYKNKTKLKLKVLIILFFVLLLIFLFFKLLNKTSSYILEYSKEEANKFTTNIINNSIDENTLKLLNNDNLYTITRNNDNEIEMIDYNTYLSNLILKNIVNNIEENINYLENDIAFYVPCGIIFNNYLFNNMGPKIPVKLKIISSIMSSIKTNIKDYGINNSLIEISVNIQLQERIMLPIISDVITYNVSIPISYKIINGNIPIYYGGTIVKESNYLLE